jgi:hypothetical protein
MADETQKAEPEKRETKPEQREIANTEPSLREGREGPDADEDEYEDHEGSLGDLRPPSDS